MPHAHHAMPSVAQTRPAAHAVLQRECTHDIDAQAALLRGWNQRYEQLSAGAFSGSVVAMNLGPVRVMHEFTSRALHQVGALARHQVAVGMPIGAHRHAVFCGRACDGGQLMVFSGDGEFQFHTPEGMQMLDFVIDKDYLQRFLTEPEQHALRMQSSSPHLQPADSASTRPLQQLVLETSALLQQQPDQPVALLDAMAAEMASQVASLLAHSVQGDEAQPLSLQRRLQWVQRARAIVMDAGADGSVTVEDLCQQLAVSRRALQYAFQDVLGTSPLAYLRAVRLNGARQAIQSCGTVAEAATAWGFWHFGRFSQDYKALFGELPSATWRRCH